jgi:hypothetical protein
VVLLLLQAGALYRQNSLFRYLRVRVRHADLCLVGDGGGSRGSGRWTVLTSSSGGFSLVAGQLSCFMLFRFLLAAEPGSSRVSQCRHRASNFRNFELSGLGTLGTP